MANRRFTTDKLFQFEVMPVLLSCNFVVDSANGNGLGIRSLKGEGIHAVYMHTSAPLAGSGNPNPAASIIQVQLSDVFSRYLSGFSGQVSPLTGTPLTTTVANAANVIVSLGTATLAQWQAVGLPVGITPAVGVAFIASSSSVIGGSAAVELHATTLSGIDHIEVLGDPNLTVSSSVPKSGQKNAIGQPNGGILLFQCALSNAVATPADGTVISLSFYLSNSSQSTKGQ